MDPGPLGTLGAVGYSQYIKYEKSTLVQSSISVVYVHRSSTKYVDKQQELRIHPDNSGYARTSAVVCPNYKLRSTGYAPVPQSTP